MEKYVHVRKDDQRRAPSRLDQLYKDNVSFRQIMSIRVDTAITDEHDVEKPLWRGDHTFSSDAAKYSLLNFIEPEVEGEHPEWSTSKVRKIALARFEQRLAQDLSYEQKESDHVESVVHWHIVETEPGHKELATDYGGETITLKKLWDHTREYAVFVGNTNAYNPEEEKAQLAMEQAFVKGDTRAYVSVLSHPDAVRYVQVWERGRDGDVVSKQVDLYASTGRDFSNSEGEQLIRHLAQYQEKIHGVEIIKSEAQYTHFMMKDGQVMEQDIRTVAILEAAIAENEIIPYPSVMPDRIIDIPQKIVQESWTALSDLTGYVSEEMNKKVRILLTPFDGPVTPRVNRSQQRMEEPVKIKDLKEQVVRDSKPETINPIKSILAEWVISNTILSYASAQPEGTGAAIFWLSYLVETGKREPVLSSPSLGLRERLFYIRRAFGLERSKKRHTESKKNIPVGHDTVPDVSIISQPQDRKSSVARVWKRIEHFTFVVQSRALIKDISQKIWGKSSEVRMNAPLTDAAVLSKEKDTSVTIAGFAILYWIVLSQKQKEIRTYRYSSDKLNADKPKERMTSTTVKPRKPLAEKNSEEVSSTWVLLSIIWYLAMIRESASTGSAGQTGLSSSLSPQITQGKNSLFPQSGIIYLFLPSDSGYMSGAFVIE